MMHRIGIVSQWQIVGGVPEITAMSLYRGIGNKTDAAGTPHDELIPSENIACVEALVDDNTLSAMQSDPQVLAIIFTEEIDQ